MRDYLSRFTFHASSHVFSYQQRFVNGDDIGFDVGIVHRDYTLGGKDGFSTEYCGNGDLNGCAASLWQSLDAAGNELAAAQGSDPSAWRSDATKERIRFSGFIPDTMRWTNRPTFQQVMVFRSHR